MRKYDYFFEIKTHSRSKVVQVRKNDVFLLHKQWLLNNLKFNQTQPGVKITS